MSIYLIYLFLGRPFHVCSQETMFELNIAYNYSIKYIQLLGHLQCSYISISMVTLSQYINILGWSDCPLSWLSLELSILKNIKLLRKLRGLLWINTKWSCPHHMTVKIKSLKSAWCCRRWINSSCSSLIYLKSWYIDVMITDTSCMYRILLSIIIFYLFIFQIGQHISLHVTFFHCDVNHTVGYCGKDFTAAVVTPDEGSVTPKPTVEQVYHIYF